MAAILEDLRADPSFTHALPSRLKEMPWESLNSMSRSTDALWRASTCAVPVLVSADDCWGGSVPDFHEVFEAVWKHKSKDTRCQVRDARCYSTMAVMMLT